MTAPVIATAPVGPATLSALAAAIARAKADDPFARVVVIADHNDAARAVLPLAGGAGDGDDQCYRADRAAAGRGTGRRRAENPAPDAGIPRRAPGGGIG